MDGWMDGWTDEYLCLSVCLSPSLCLSVHLWVCRSRRRLRQTQPARDCSENASSIEIVHYATRAAKTRPAAARGVTYKTHSPYESIHTIRGNANVFKYIEYVHLFLYRYIYRERESNNSRSDRLVVPCCSQMNLLG